MKYPVKVWLLTIVIAPFIFLVTMLFYNRGESNSIVSVFPLVFFMILFGTLFSIPSLFLFWFLSDELDDRGIKSWIKKCFLSLVGVVFVWLTFFLMNKNIFRDWNFNDYIWPGVYSLVLVVITLALRIPESKKI
jgi:uncharacterized membrane-anchored protein